MTATATVVVIALTEPELALVQCAVSDWSSVAWVHVGEAEDVHLTAPAGSRRPRQASD
jgi:hypothetical protein